MYSCHPRLMLPITVVTLIRASTRRGVKLKKKAYAEYEALSSLAYTRADSQLISSGGHCLWPSTAPFPRELCI